MIRIIFLSLLLLFVKTVSGQEDAKPQLTFESGEPIVVTNDGFNDQTYFSANNRYFAIVPIERDLIKIYDAITGLPLKTIKTKGANYNNLQFSNDFNYFKYTRLKTPGEPDSAAYQAIGAVFSDSFIFKRQLTDYYSQGISFLNKAFWVIDAQKIFLQSLTDINDTLSLSSVWSGSNTEGTLLYSIPYYSAPEIDLISVPGFTIKKILCTQTDIGDGFSFSDDNKYLFQFAGDVSDFYRTLKIIDISKDSVIFKKQYYSNGYQDIKQKTFGRSFNFNSQTGLLTLPSQDGLHVFNLFKNTEDSIFFAKQDQPVNADISNDGRSIIFSNNTLLKIYDIKTRKYSLDEKFNSGQVLLSPETGYIYVSNSNLPSAVTKIYNLATQKFTDSLQGLVLKIAGNGKVLFAQKNDQYCFLNQNFRLIKFINYCTDYFTVHLTNDPDYIITERNGPCHFQKTGISGGANFYLWNIRQLTRMENQLDNKKIIVEFGNLKNCYISKNNFLYQDFNAIRCLNDSSVKLSDSMQGQLMAMQGRYAVSLIDSEDFASAKNYETLFLYQDFQNIFPSAQYTGFTNSVDIDSSNKKIFVLVNDFNETPSNKILVFTFDGVMVGQYPLKISADNNFETYHYNIEFSNNKKYILLSSQPLGSDDLQTQFYNAKTGDFIFQLEKKNGNIAYDSVTDQAIEIEPDTIYIRSLKTGQIAGKQQFQVLALKGKLALGIWKTIYTGNDNNITSADFSQAITPAGFLKYNNKETLALINWSNNKILYKRELAFGSVTSGAISNNNNVIAYSNNDNDIIIAGINDTKDMPVLKGHNNEINSIVFSANDSVLFSSSMDGYIKLWSLKNFKEKLSIIDFDEDGYLITNNDGYYKCTKNALPQFGFDLKEKAFASTQFDLHFNRPDILLKSADNTDTALINCYNEAYLKRVKRAGLDDSYFSDSIQIPQTQILNLDELPLFSDKKDVLISLKFNDDSNFLNSYRILDNGIPVNGVNGYSLKNLQTHHFDTTVLVYLTNGFNKIEASCYNTKGWESLKEISSITYQSKEKQPEPKTYFIGIGVSNYQDGNMTLHYAAKDIRDLAEIFKTKFSNCEIDTFIDEDATKEKILSIKDSLKKSGIEDRVIISVSGHGILDKNYNFYFATVDMDFGNPSKKGLLYDDMEGLLDDIPARKKLLLIDACNSGEIDRDVSFDTASNNPEKPDEYNKGVKVSVKKGSLNIQNSFELMQDVFADLSHGNGSVVISAAGGLEYALEDPKYGNGIFTYCLKKALLNKEADKNSDGMISVSELKDYVSEMVEKLTNGRQKPTARKEVPEFDWKVW